MATVPGVVDAARSSIAASTWALDVGTGGVVEGATPSFSAIATRMNVFWVSDNLSAFGMSGTAGVGNSPGSGGRVRREVLKDESAASS